MGQQRNPVFKQMFIFQRMGQIWNSLYDIIDSTGEISENVILEKLGNKHSWIMEFSKLKNAIPTTWKIILKSNCSIQAKVKTNLTLKLRLNKGKVFNLENTNNKIIYNTLISRKFSFPYIHTYWNTYFDKITCWKKCL